MITLCANRVSGPLSLRERVRVRAASVVVGLPVVADEGQPCNRRGFTLLEIVLALSLAVVVFGLVGMAIDIYLRVADTSRKEVEEAQLARALLQRIAEDVRNAVPFSPGTSSGGSSSGVSSAGGSSEASSGSSSSGTPSFGGIYGNSQQLQVEISRLPRGDRAGAAAANGDSGSSAGQGSDLRTVTYGIAGLDTLSDLNSAATSGPRGGLMRCELDSASFNFLAQQGDAGSQDHATEMLAPEVEGIEFTYLDGGTELEEWDSQTQGKLPTAVRITLALRRAPRRSALAVASSTEESPPQLYDLLVYLPNSSVTPEPSDSGSSGDSAAKPTDAASADSAGKDSAGGGGAKPAGPNDKQAGPNDKQAGPKPSRSGPGGITPVGPGGTGIKPIGPGNNAIKPIGPGNNAIKPVGPGGTGIKPFGAGDRGIKPLDPGTKSIRPAGPGARGK
jgi:hypothetical protein